MPDLAGGAFLYSRDKDAGHEIGWAGLYSSKNGKLLRSFTGERLDHLGFAITWLADPSGQGPGKLAADLRRLTRAGFRANWQPVTRQGNLAAHVRVFALGFRW